MHLLYTIICECTTLYNTSVILTPYKTPPYTSRTCIRVYNNIIVGIFYYILSTMGDTPQYTGSVLLDTVCTGFFCITEALWSEVTFWEYGKVIVVLCRCGHYARLSSVHSAHYLFRTLPSATAPRAAQIVRIFRQSWEVVRQFRIISDPGNILNSS